MKLAVISLLSAVAFAGCVSRPTERWVSLNQSLEISPAEMPDLVARANDGSPEAAKRLADYYTYIEDKPDQAVHWLRKAAVAGDRIGQYNLGLTLWQRFPDPASQQEALEWLEKAAAQGLAIASDVIEEIKQRANQRPDGTPVKSPPSNPGQVSGVPHP